mgnify:CR=1 FL=1
MIRRLMQAGVILGTALSAPCQSQRAAPVPIDDNQPAKKEWNRCLVAALAAKDYEAFGACTTRYTLNSAGDYDPAREREIAPSPDSSLDMELFKAREELKRADRDIRRDRSLYRSGLIP